MGFQPSAWSGGYGAVELGGTRPVVGTDGVPIPGVYMKPGVVLNESMLSFLAAIQQRLGFNLVVNSGVRTPADQARALAQDYNFKVYGAGNKLVAELTANGANPRPSEATMRSILEQQVMRGQYLSRHMRGDALDFSIRGLTPTERSALLTTARELVGTSNAIDESDHIHVEELSGIYPMLVTGLKVGVGVTTAVVGGSLIIGAAVIYYYRAEIRKLLQQRTG